MEISLFLEWHTVELPYKSCDAQAIAEWIKDGNSRTVGHFIMRYINGDNRQLRFGWVIVDGTLRGKVFSDVWVTRYSRFALLSQFNGL